MEGTKKIFTDTFLEALFLSCIIFLANSNYLTFNEYLRALQIETFNDFLTSLKATLFSMFIITLGFRQNNIFALINVICISGWLIATTFLLSPIRIDDIFFFVLLIFFLKWVKSFKKKDFMTIGTSLLNSWKDLWKPFSTFSFDGKNFIILNFKFCFHWIKNFLSYYLSIVANHINLIFSLSLWYTFFLSYYTYFRNYLTPKFKIITIWCIPLLKSYFPLLTKVFIDFWTFLNSNKFTFQRWIFTYFWLLVFSWAQAQIFGILLILNPENTTIFFFFNVSFRSLRFVTVVLRLLVKFFVWWLKSRKTYGPLVPTKEEKKKSSSSNSNSNYDSLFKRNISWCMQLSQRKEEKKNSHDPFKNVQGSYTSFSNFSSLFNCSESTDRQELWKAFERYQTGENDWTARMQEAKGGKYKNFFL